jgi:hypothetical protein
VNLDLVKITMRSGSDDAIHLRTNCTGRIGRIEIDTWVADGVKVNAPAPAAHDLTVGGGYIRCHEHAGAVHQDGIQVMGGQRLTFRNLEINCNSRPNSMFFVQAARGGMPTDVICDGCFLGSGAASTLRIEESIRSGARNTVACPGRWFDLYFQRGVAGTINVGNRVLPASDPRC